jgi:hypothetical protein
MSYTWGTAAFPAATFDGQVQVDHLNEIYQWNAGAGVWVKCPEYRLEELRSASVYAYGVAVGQDPFRKQRSMLENHWDVAFNRALVSVESVDDPNVVYGRIAHVSFAELQAWIPTVVPTSGGTYDVHYRIRVIQVTDARRKPDRVFGWNGMYGSMRGRDAMRSTKGRNDLSLPDSCGYDPKFRTAFPTTAAPEVLLVQLFCGQTPATEQPRAIWFPRRRNNLTVMPKNNSATLRPSYMNRYCWNDTTQLWEAITSDVWMTEDTINCVNPACIAVGNDFTNAEVGELKTYMRGGGTNLITYRRTAVVVYHLRDGGDAHKHAFYVKPLGINTMAADIQVPLVPWELMAVNLFDGDGGNARFVKVPNVQNRQPNDGWRWSIQDTLDPRVRASGAKNWNISTDRIPQEIKYYLRNNVTGVVSPYFPGSVEIARRRYNMAMGFLERRG